MDTLGHILQRVNDLHRKVDIIMTQQDEVNADVTELTTAEQAISGKLGDLNAQIAALEAAQQNGQALDLTALKTEADALAALVPAPSSTPAVPEPPAPTA